MNNLTNQNKVLIGALAFAIVLGIFMLVRGPAPEDGENTVNQNAETQHPSSQESATLEPEPAQPSDPEQHARIMALMEAWPTEPNFHDGFYALAPMLSNAPSGATSIKFDPQDEYWGLPREPGYEEVEGYCSACHSLEIVMQQHVPPERWVELLVWMQEKQGMPEPTSEDYILILNYLQANFGAVILAQP